MAGTTLFHKAAFLFSQRAVVGGMKPIRPRAAAEAALKAANQTRANPGETYAIHNKPDDVDLTFTKPLQRPEPKAPSMGGSLRHAIGEAARRGPGSAILAHVPPAIFDSSDA